MRTRLRCAHCGRPRRADQLVYSRHTGQRYCAVNLAACEAKGRLRVTRARAKAGRMRDEGQYA